MTAGQGRKAAAWLAVPIFVWCSSSLSREIDASQADPFPVGLALKEARAYCGRLESAALDFVCLEYVSEKIDPAPRGARVPVSLVPQNLEINPVSNRPGGLKERRSLLLENGKRVKKRGSPPATTTFKYQDILLAPVELLDERFSASYVYRLVPEEGAPVDGEPLVVLEAVPKPDAFPPRLGGRVSLRREDSSVLRIDWDPSTFDNYDVILARAKLLDADPRVTSYTEYGFEKSGLRFPSVDFTEEAYVLKDGKTFVRARTRIEYKDYKFFTVETRSELKKGGE